MDTALVTAMSAHTQELQSRYDYVSYRLFKHNIVVFPDFIAAGTRKLFIGPVDVYVSLTTHRNNIVPSDDEALNVLKSLVKIDDAVSEIMIEMKHPDNVGVFRAHTLDDKNHLWRSYAFGKLRVYDEDIARLIQFAHNNGQLTINIMSDGDMNYREYTWHVCVELDFSDTRNKPTSYSVKLFAYNTIREIREWDPEYANADPNTRCGLYDRVKKLYHQGRELP